MLNRMSIGQETPQFEMASVNSVYDGSNKGRRPTVVLLRRQPKPEDRGRDQALEVE